MKSLHPGITGHFTHKNQKQISATVIQTDLSIASVSYLHGFRVKFGPVCWRADILGFVVVLLLFILYRK